MNAKLLKTINYASITITVGLTIVFFGNLLGNSLYRNDGRFLRLMPTLITLLILVFLSVIILIKSNQQKGNMMFALFLSFISDDWLLQFFQIMNRDWVPDELLLSVSIITGTVYIKAFQFFPRQITEEDVKTVFSKSKILSGYITLAIKNNTWIHFQLFLAVLPQWVVPT